MNPGGVISRDQGGGGHGEREVREPTAMKWVEAMEEERSEYPPQ